MGDVMGAFFTLIARFIVAINGAAKKNQQLRRVRARAREREQDLLCSETHPFTYGVLDVTDAACDRVVVVVLCA